MNGPLTLVTHVGGAEDRLALDSLDSTLRATAGVASVTPAAYDTGGDAAYLTVVPDSAPQSQTTSDLVDRLRTEVLPAWGSGLPTSCRRGDGELRRLRRRHRRQAAPLRGRRDRSRLRPAPARLPLARHPAEGSRDEHRRRGRRVRGGRSNLQWGWGSELLGLGRAGPIEPFLP